MRDAANASNHRVFSREYRRRWVDDAFDAEDGWALMAALAVGERAMSEANSTAAILHEYLAPAGCQQVLDVGAGLGRHLLPLADLGYSVYGIEPSRILCRVANDVLQSHVVEQKCYGDLRHAPVPAEAVLIMSDTLSLLLDAGPLDIQSHLLSATNRRLSLFAEVSAPQLWPRPGVQRWPGPHGIEATETVTVDGNVAERTVTFTCRSRSFTMHGRQLLLTADELASNLTEVGLKVTDVVPLARGCRTVAEPEKLLLVCSD